MASNSIADDDILTRLKAIRHHYVGKWHGHVEEATWPSGPVTELPAGFHVLIFSPTLERQMWTYATCGMSVVEGGRVELHLFSPNKEDSLVELLTAVAHYHCTEAALGLGHTVNFGRPWLAGSKCEFGLISLPYLDGPELENLCVDGTKDVVKNYWLIPITESEREFKKRRGIEELEKALEAKEFDYLDPGRDAVV